MLKSTPICHRMSISQKIRSASAPQTTALYMHRQHGSMIRRPTRLPLAARSVSVSRTGLAPRAPPEYAMRRHARKRYPTPNGGHAIIPARAPSECHTRNSCVGSRLRAPAIRQSCFGLRRPPSPSVRPTDHHSTAIAGLAALQYMLLPSSRRARAHAHSRA